MTLLDIDGQQIEAEELISERGPHAKHYALPDGRRVAVLQQGQHYADRDTGAWEPTDNAVTAEARPDGFSVAVNRAPLRARFGPRGRHRLGFGVGQYLTLSASNVAQVVAPVADGNRVTYPGLWPDADLSYEHGLERVKETITLHSLAAPASYAFRVAEQGGVSLVANADGGIDVLDAQGATVGRMLAPFCEDANGERGGASLAYDGAYLTVTLDATWLADPARVVPVLVDPTVELQPGPAGIDTYANQASPDTNYGSSASLWITTASNLKDIWMTPDLSSVPIGSAVSNAYLNIYLASSGGPSVTPMSADAAWAESALTWNNRPAYGNWTGTNQALGSSAPDWSNNISITNLVEDWVLGARINYGVVLEAYRWGTSFSAEARSSDFDTSSLRPKLTITYTSPPTVTVTSPNGTQASPTAVSNQVSGMSLSGVYNSADSVDMAYRQHQIHDEAGNLIWDSGKTSASATPGSTVSVTTPAGYLKYGVKYRWRWMAWDTNGGYSAWTANGTGDGCWFQCVLTVPTGLTATADAANAEIDLSWTAHGGENLAGYNVYRKPAGAADSEYKKINITTVGTNSYTDRAVGRGVAYDYAITAVATDTYESAKSTAAEASVTWDAGDWWLEALKLPGVDGWEAEDGFKTSEQEVLGKSVPVHQKVGPDGGRTGARITLALDEVTETEYQDILAELEKPDPLALRDPLGRVWRVKISRSLRRSQIVPSTTAKYRVVVPLREVVR